MTSLTRLVAAALCLAGSPLAAQEGARAPVLQVVARPAASQEQRVALVIGNNAYKDAPLTNPINDARAISDALRASGFAVTLRTDITHRDFLVALREFGDALRKGGVGVFYFAGHGVQIKGRNYLVPVGATIEREDEVAYAAVDAQAVLDKMEAAGNTTNLVILDACRNNPFARSFRSSAQGLAQMDAPVGTLVAFATSPGSVASDGTGQNGLYTQHLLKAMREPGLKVEDVFKQTRAAVRRESQGKQIPWESTSMEGDFYFVQPAPAPPPPSPMVGRPSATQESPLKLDDIEAEFLGRQQGARQLAQMQRDFDRVIAFTTDPDLQHHAWERFLSAWSADIPDSTGDEALRDQARTRLQALRQRPTQTAAAAGPGGRPQVAATSAGSVGSGGNANAAQEVLALRSGDSLTYEIQDLYTSVRRFAAIKVAQHTGSTIGPNVNNPKSASLQLGTPDRTGELGDFELLRPPSGWFPWPLHINQTWSADYKAADAPPQSRLSLQAQVLRREDLQTPVGRFATWMIQYNGTAWRAGGATPVDQQTTLRLWIDISSGVAVRFESEVRGGFGSQPGRPSREKIEISKLAVQGVER